MNNTVVTAASVALAVSAAVKIRSNMKLHRKMREEIEANALIEIAAIEKARDIMLEKIRTGEYMPSSIAQIRTDIEFYTIATLES